MATILLVEDDETSRDMLTLRLELQGHEVQAAGDGMEAMGAATSLLPDLVLLDMNLPELDGWTVARRLREQESTAHLKIIGVSAHAMQGDRDKAIAAGCDEYETKPVEWGRLSSKIEALLKEKE